VNLSKFPDLRMNHFSSHISLIDHVVELFEQQWTADDRGLIGRLLNDQPVDVRESLLLELLRADIGRRYAVGHDVDLDDYFLWFPELGEQPEAIAAICFEDFRARRHRGRSLVASRWSHHPAIQNQSWFLELQSASLEMESSCVFESENGACGNIQTEESSSSASSSASSLSSAETLEDTVVLGDFELAGLLGQGAFSKVYLARQKSLGGRYVAIKVVHEPLREASHLARLQHTGIVPLYSCHRTRDKWILCMPYSGSATLADWMKGEATPSSRTGQSLVATIQNAQNRITEAGSQVRGPYDFSILNADQKSSLRAWHNAATQPLHQLASMPAAEFSLWIARRLASALAHAHQRGIVHGDLKPANILIRNDGEPALIDFNLSQITDAAPKSWRGGTFPYMAAEQLKAIIARIKDPARSNGDVFAFGVILFEIVEGQLPFGVPASLAETDLQLAVQQRASIPEFRERQTCTEGLRSIIRKCLTEDPANRYSSAATLLEDLDCEAANVPLRHASESFVRSRLPKLIRRFPRLFSGGSITIASLLLIGILMNSLLSFKQRSERLASLEAIKAFEQQSDLRFARFLQMDSSTDQQAPGFTPNDLMLLQTLVSEHLSPEVDLATEDRTRAEERLLALAFIEAHGSLRSSAARNARRESLQTLITLLPASAKSSQVGQLIQAIASGTPAAKTALSSQKTATARVSTPVNSAERTIDALALMLQSEPRKSLELLEYTDPPESLRLIHWMTCGRALLEIGESRRAVTAFTMAMRGSSASGVLLNRGMAYFRLGSLSEADADFTTCIQQSSADVSGYLNRYAVRTAMGRTNEAMLDLNRAIELQPESARLRLIRSRELRSAGHLKAAREDFEFAMKSRPSSVEDWLSVALAKLSMDPQQSLQDLESAETLHGPDASILQTMAHVLSEHLQRPDDAIRALDRVLQLEPAFQKALAGRAVLHARLGNVELALADVQRLESPEVSPTAEAQYQMACSLALCSQTQSNLRTRAIKLLAQAVRQNYGGELMATDADLDAIRSLPEFQIIQKNHLIISTVE
jgi:serine/threonine protein kinase/tetratricopeptide (TPR) repeat protein